MYLPIEELAKLFRKYRPYGVNFVGIGRKEVGGRPTGELAIVFSVEKKLPKDEVVRIYRTEEAVIPREIEIAGKKLLTDVKEYRKIRAIGRLSFWNVLGRLRKRGKRIACKEVEPAQQEDFTKRVRPVKPGYSCGSVCVTACSLNIAFKDKETGKVYLSTCAHCAGLLRYEKNRWFCDYPVKDKCKPLLQPGPLDGGKVPDDIVAYLERISNFTLGHAPERPLMSDFALCKLREDVKPEDFVQNVLPDGTEVKDIVEFPDIGAKLYKVGRTSGVIDGLIVDAYGLAEVDYDVCGYRYVMCGVGVPGAPIKGGDSGSVLVLSDDHHVWCGVLFGASEQVFVFSPPGYIASDPAFADFLNKYEVFTLGKTEYLYEPGEWLGEITKHSKPSPPPPPPTGKLEFRDVQLEWLLPTPPESGLVVSGKVIVKSDSTEQPVHHAVVDVYVDGALIYKMLTKTDGSFTNKEIGHVIRDIPCNQDVCKFKVKLVAKKYKPKGEQA